MIPRTVLASIEESIRFKPVTLVTGARQVGKTTLCRLIAEKHGFGYVSLATGSERAMTVRDPEMFLNLHPALVIIEESSTLRASSRPYRALWMPGISSPVAMPACTSSQAARHIG